MASQKGRLLPSTQYATLSYVLTHVEGSCLRNFFMYTSKMSKINFICLIIVYACFAKEPLKIDIPNQGTIMGTEISMIRTKKIRAFLAIPYAQPPLQNYRFMPPITDPLPLWDGVRNATKYAPGCLQSKNDYNPQDLPFLNLIDTRSKDDPYILDEDCLYLNVFVPSGKRFPIL